MRTMGYRNKISGAILALSLVFGIGMIAGTTAQAQDRNDGRWRRDDGRNRSDRQDRDWRRNRNDDRYRGRRDDRYDRNDRGNDPEWALRELWWLQQRQSDCAESGLSGRHKHWAQDARRGQSYSPQRSKHYKDARSQQFRDGFVRGYAEGFRQYGGYNNNGDYRRNNGTASEHPRRYLWPPISPAPKTTKTSNLPEECRD